MSNQGETPIEEVLRRIPKDYRINISMQRSEGGIETGFHLIPIGHHVHRAANEITDLREQLAEAIAIRDRSITRMVEMAEPGFIGAFAARDMAIERTKKAEVELAACSAAFDWQQNQLDRNADQIVELVSETKLVVEKNKVLCELLAKCQKDADRYARVRQHLRNGHNTLDMRGTGSDADFDALLDKHLTQGNKVYNYSDITSEVTQEAAAHTDHPLRHYDRTCPACNPKEEWVGLTDEEISTTLHDFAKAIEAKLKEKNGG